MVDVARAAAQGRRRAISADVSTSSAEFSAADIMMIMVLRGAAAHRRLACPGSRCVSTATAAKRARHSSARSPRQLAAFARHAPRRL